MNIRIRERLAEVAAKFKRIEVALFTTFNFNSDFFEQNVLPALFALPLDGSRASREQLVHRGLLHTRVGVVCDPSQLRRSGKAYRYTTYPVFVPNRFFHAKNIILVGLDDEEARWIYVAASSANLSLSGWGRNCEGFADTWIHSANEQPSQALNDYLGWIKERAGIKAAEDALNTAMRLCKKIQEKRTRDDPEGGNYRRKKNKRLYFSPVHRESMWSFLRVNYGEIGRVRAASPYWGGGTAIAKELDGVPLHLTAARIPPRMTINLGKDLVSLFKSNSTKVVLDVWRAELTRLYHVKLYEVETVSGHVTGAGSCNFTESGQFWLGASDINTGNVESMLFDVEKIDWPETQPLKFDGLPDRSTDDAPLPWPFYVYVQYDWRTRELSWRLEGELGGVEVELRLTGRKSPILLTSRMLKGRELFDLQSRTFTLSWSGREEEGSVCELNLDASTETYGRRLKAEEILDSWRGGSPVEPVPPDGGGDKEGEPASDDGDGNPEETPAQVTLDYFQLFQAIKNIGFKIEGSRKDERDLIDILIGRSDSVLALADSFRGRPIIERWIVWQECLALLEFGGNAR